MNIGSHTLLPLAALAFVRSVQREASVDRLLERIDRRGVAAERSISRHYLESLNEVYSEFFLYYDAAPLLIVNANQIDLINRDEDFVQLVDYALGIKAGRHYFNPTLID